MRKRILLSLWSLVFVSGLVLAATDPAIKGEVRLGPDIKKPSADAAILFVFARPLGTNQGPPAAVVKIPSPKFPQPFSLSSANAMMPGTSFKGKFQLYAKLSNTGSATTSKGDLLGKLAPEKGISPGETKVVIVLDKVAP
jgi:hypothetical protein